MDDVMRKNIEEYHSAIKTLFDKDSDMVFPNNIKEHTAAIIQEIFLHAHKYVKVLCNCLNHDVWNDPEIEDAFINAYFRGVKFQFITQKDVDPDTKLTALIKGLEFPVKENAATNIPCNFIVADHKMFRFEENAQERHASASANHPVLAQKLDAIFDRLFNGEGERE